MKKSKKSFLKSNTGFSLIEVLVVIAVSSFLMTGATMLVLESQKTEKTQEKIYWLMEQRMA
ncbi:MAG: prepilin-type N-terminal cleavage/methylation domain-containing protein, partial [Bdellovibrionaceae bacterium]|nr:prepilin-type N-terminal cleavage/methylation domain-containing protein [Pseudobdellovibrionaceae bacterium]